MFGAREYDTAHPPALNARLRERYDAILASGRKPIIVDAGANIGAATIWFNTIYPKARIVAVEPDAENAEILRRNTDGRANVTVVEAAIGSSPGFVTLSNPELAGASPARAGPRDADHDHARGICRVRRRCSFLVKIDIEGFESDLFASNLEWLSETFAITIEPHDWLFPGQRTSGTLQRAMAQHPFEMFIRGENLFYVRA